MILPNIPPFFTSPNLDYAIAQKLQLALIAKLGWLDKAYHIAKIGIDSHGKSTYPQIYANNGTDKHFNIRPDSKCSAYSFFEVDRPSEININDDEAVFYLSIVFWCNLPLIDPAKGYDFTSELIKDVSNVLYVYEAEDLVFENRPELIFNKYSALKQEYNQHLMKQYSGFKVTFKIKDSYINNCSPTVINSCDLNTSRIENLPESVKNCVLLNVCEAVPCADGFAVNSDASYSLTVPSGTTQPLPDISFTDTDGSIISLPSNKAVTATPIENLSCSQLNSKLTIAQRQVIQRVNPFDSTGNALACNNHFGNLNRFTDIAGGNTYANNLVLDWLTGYMWYRIPLPASNHPTAITTAAASNQGGYSGYFLPEVWELFKLVAWNIQPGLNRSPFNLSGEAVGDRLWTKTEQAGNTNNAYIYDPTSSRTINLGSLKGSSHIFIIARKFTLSDL